MSLDTQTTKFFITIRKNKQFDKELLTSFCTKQEGVEIYAYIEHLKDVSKETGCIEGCHYHFVIVRRRTRINTMYGLIREHFQFSNLDGVKVECAKSVEGCIQYLIHKNDILKTQHQQNEIVTNLSQNELNNYIDAEPDTITFDKVYNLCFKNDDILNVIKEIGFTRYNLYRNTIQDIYKATQRRKLNNIKSFKKSVDNYNFD